MRIFLIKIKQFVKIRIYLNKKLINTIQALFQTLFNFLDEKNMNLFEIWSFFSKEKELKIFLKLRFKFDYSTNLEYRYNIPFALTKR